MSEPYDQAKELTPKEALEHLELTLLNLSTRLRDKIGMTESSLFLMEATKYVGEVATQLHVLESLSSMEFQLVLHCLEDCREEALHEVMEGDGDMSPVDFVDGILTKLNKGIEIED